MHYLWIFIAEFGNLVLYGAMFFYLQHRMKQARILRQNREHLARLNRVVIYMVIYPLVYLCLSLPLAAGRMSTATNNILSKTYFAVAGCLMALSGLVDTLVYTLTRRQIVLEADTTRSDPYYGFSNSMYQTHITASAGEKSSKKRTHKGSRFRRGLGTNLSTVDDDGEGSTEDIVRKEDMELNDMSRGVYQETTIEITHEPIESAEQFHSANHD